jgi:hypothetical protein
VLKKISGDKAQAVIGQQMKLHNEELHNLYTSLNIIRKVVSEEY